MHDYLVMVQVPSTAPLYGVNGLQTTSKLRVAGFTKASNSSSACSKVSKRLDIPYSKLKALLVQFRGSEKRMWMEKHTTQ